MKFIDVIAVACALYSLYAIVSIITNWYSISEIHLRLSFFTIMICMFYVFFPIDTDEYKN